MGELYSDEQRTIRDAAHDFSQECLAPHAAQWDCDGRLPAEVVTQMGEPGLLDMIVPATRGGTHTDDVAYALAIEEIAAGWRSNCIRRWVVKERTRWISRRSSSYIARKG